MTVDDALAALRRGTRLGEIGADELFLTGVATFKLSRVRGSGSGGEVREVGRGEGVQEAVGDLRTCPFCTGHWVATGLVMGHATAPGAAHENQAPA
jgi:hypothetical protein